MMLLRGYLNVLNISNRYYLKAIYWQHFSSTHGCRFLQLISHSRFSSCFVHSGPKSDESHDPIIDFESMLKIRRDEAQRSILVQIQSEQSCPVVHDYCSQFGKIEHLFFYSLQETSHFALVEFSEISNVTKVIEECGHIDLNRVIPVRSPFLWFRSGGKEKPLGSSTKNPITQCYKTGRTKPPNSELTEWLTQAETVSDQMLLLHKSTSLDDLASRLRFLTARQVETSIAGIFPVNKCLLFGSSVNGFGRLGCDLDLLIQFDMNSEERFKKRLVFHTKSSLVNSRTQIQKHLEALADLLQLFLPGCAGVKRIFQARVPIMKYKQELTGIDCDLSMSNMTAIYMSELLYTFGNIDWRVRPLVFTVKKWASEVNLTNPIPGRWITNFSLTILVIFYLQQIKVLPSLDDLVKMSGQNDKRMSEDGVNCTFLRDVTRLRTSSVPSVSSLVTLLHGFFEYYASFDFNMKAIGLGCGMPLPKQDYAPLYIINPLERHLNVSKNVSAEEIERLKIELRNAMWELESSNKLEGKGWSEPWGLVSLFKGNDYNKKAKDLFSPVRISKSLNLNSVNNSEKAGSTGASHIKETKLKGRRR